MPGQTTRGDMVGTWADIGAALRGGPQHQQTQFIDASTPHGALEWRTAPTRLVHEDDGPAVEYKPLVGRAELEIDRNHWKREALRYKQLLMDMLGKEVE